jgi:hypothetical protein
MNLNFRLWKKNLYYYLFIILTALIVTFIVLMPDLRIIMILVIALLVFSWLFLLKREWDLFAKGIKNYLSDFNPKVTYSILGGTTFLNEPALPFTKKFLRPSLGASLIYRGVRLRINFLFFNPELNPLISGSDYDYEVLILDFDNDKLTNELYSIGFKEKDLPNNIKVLLDASFNDYYIKNEEYARNPELFINNLLGVLNKYLK